MGVGDGWHLDECRKTGRLKVGRVADVSSKCKINLMRRFFIITLNSERDLKNELEVKRNNSIPMILCND